MLRDSFFPSQCQKTLVAVNPSVENLRSENYGVKLDLVYYSRQPQWITILVPNYLTLREKCNEHNLTKDGNHRQIHTYICLIGERHDMCYHTEI